MTLQAVGPIRALDSNADPVSGNLTYFFEAGTTTPVTTYADVAGVTANAHPIVADSDGVASPIYIAAGNYKIDVTTPEGVSLPGFPIDDVAIEAFAIRAQSGFPASFIANEITVDTSGSGFDRVYQRNAANDAWVLLGARDTSTDTFYAAGTEISRQTLTTSDSVTPPAYARTYDRLGAGGGAAGAGCVDDHSGGSRGDAGLGGNAGSEGIKRGVSLSGVSSITITIGAGGAGVDDLAGNDGGDTTIADGVNTDTVFAGGKAQAVPDTSTTPRTYQATTENDACTFVDEETKGAVSEPSFTNANGSTGYSIGGRGGSSSQGQGGRGGAAEGITNNGRADGENATGLASGGGGAVRASVTGANSGTATGGDGTGGWATVIFYA